MAVKKFMVCSFCGIMMKYDSKRKRWVHEEKTECPNGLQPTEEAITHA